MWGTNHKKPILQGVGITIINAQVIITKISALMEVKA